MDNRGDRKKEADDPSEEICDSGFDSVSDSFRSINQEYHRNIKKESPKEADDGDKLDSVAEDRLDSSYGSSSISSENLSEFLQSCKITEEKYSKRPETEGLTQQEIEILTSINEDGDTILHLAIIHEEQHFALYLISLFPKDFLDMQNDLYQTPLHLATYLNQPVVVQALVEKKACLELQDQDGNTPLHVACAQGYLECANELTRDNVDAHSNVLKMQNWRGMTCMHVAVLQGNHQFIELLMRKKANINVQEGTSGKTLLHLAVELHDQSLVSLLLKKGANVDMVMYNGCTPLHLAVGRQDASIANLLCQSGADKLLRNMEGETAQDLADGNNDILALFPFDDIQISGRSVVNF
ncbi:NF-kappa-B inhibitor epsilon-like [Polyodon spathula]|uniref:NF-kappa-B inhibitor epsilon-like n=1 Tax=Polyodon spathula TaxID=7913 RepID=UPI001B7E08C6|nr:NF-kappa-B inhibitor epsilon-like [Polyodon spathula]